MKKEQIEQFITQNIGTNTPVSFVFRNKKDTGRRTISQAKIIEKSADIIKIIDSVGEQHNINIVNIGYISMGMQ